MTEQEKQVLAGLCRIEIKRWKAAAESNPNMRYMVALMDVALASLTAESGWIKCSDRMPELGKEVLCIDEVAEMMFPLISTAWCVFWLVNLMHAVDYSEHSGMAVITSWFIIGWLPPIFYKLMAMKWGG